MIEYPTISYKEKQPVGEAPGHIRFESKHLLALGFEKVKNYPELLTTTTIVTEELNGYRALFGLKVLPTEEDAIRLISEQVYDSDPLTQRSEGGAFFHPGNRKAFVRFDGAKYNSSAFEKMRTIYAVAHELTHRAMEKNGLSSFLKIETPTFDRLTEGLVDRLTKDMLNRRILPSVTSVENMQSRASYIYYMRPKHDGLKLREDEIIPTADGESPIAFSYIPEIRLIEYLQRSKPEISHMLLRTAFHGDRDAASKLLEESFGSDMRDKLGDLNVPTGMLFAEMTGKK